MNAYWQTVRDGFGTREQQPPVPPMLEEFGSSPPAPQFHFQLMAPNSVPRYWLRGDDGSRLIQLQEDRFGYNWKQTAENPTYPRFETIKAEFDNHFDAIRRMVDKAPVPNFCEVAYINTVVPVEGDRRPRLDDLLAFVTPIPGDFLPEPEDAQVAARFLVPHPAGDGVVGRLYFSAVPAIRPEDGLPIYVVDVTVRGRPLEDTTEGAMAFLELAHEWVVKGFDALTGESMHKVWRRT